MVQCVKIDSHPRHMDGKTHFMNRISYKILLRKVQEKKSSKNQVDRSEDRTEKDSSLGKLFELKKL